MTIKEEENYFKGLVHWSQKSMKKPLAALEIFFLLQKRHFNKVAAFHLLLRYKIQTISKIMLLCLAWHHTFNRDILIEA